MKSQNVILAIVLICLLGSGCALQSSGSHTLISGAAIMASSDTPQVKSEAFAKGAEDLLSAEAFQQSDDMAVAALNQDPNNFRALFVRALLEPLLVERGIAARLKPLADTDPYFSSKLGKSVADLKAGLGVHNANAFLLDGRPDITTENELQLQADKLAEALDHLREFLNVHRSEEITLKVPPLFSEEFTRRYADACKVQVNAQYEYELTCPPSSTRHVVSLNRADFEVLHDMVTFYFVAFLAPNSFDFSGFLAVDAKAQAHQITNRQTIFDQLLKNEKFGTVRDAKALKRIRRLGLELIAGIQWGLDNQSILCPQGLSGKSDRPGMLINEGICLPSSFFGPMLASLKPNFSGQARAVVLQNDGPTYETNIDWTALFDNPLSDIRALGPVTFDTRNELTHIGDQTAGGMFPAGDADKVLALKNVGVSYK